MIEDIQYFIGNDNFLSESIGSTFLEKNINLLKNEKYKTIHLSEIVRDAKDDGSIVYNYNESGYRCDNFTKQTDRVRVVFSGCSETEGVGNNIEDTWSFLVHKYLKNYYDVDGYFNLGLSGIGYEKIISNLLNFIKIYGDPDYIFILLPNIGRWIEWIDDYKGYQQIGLNPWHNGKKNKNDTTLKDQRDILINFILTMRLFESYCEAKNIKLLWATWDQKDEDNYSFLLKKGIFKNFIRVKNDKIEASLLVDKTNNPKKLLARDGHLGLGFHELWADAFIDNFIKQKLGENNAKI
jgi:hypothetical protein